MGMLLKSLTRLLMSSTSMFDVVGTRPQMDPLISSQSSGVGYFTPMAQRNECSLTMFTIRRYGRN